MPTSTSSTPKNPRLVPLASAPAGSHSGSSAYWHAWGPANFLHLCDIAVILTCIGLSTNNALLLSSQAVSSVLIDLVWTLDAAARLIFGHHLIGGTEYLFDATTPLWARLLSLFHIVLPFILLWSLSRLGYDRRGWKLQSAILLPVLIASRFVTPDQNLNFAVKDPFLHRSYGPAPTHLFHHFPLPRLRGLFPHALALQPPVPAATWQPRPGER